MNRVGRIDTMQFSEPVTMLTDYVLAAASLAFALGVRRVTGAHNRVSAWLWCAAFIASAIAATLGGTYHGFAANLGEETHRTLWNMTVFSIGACGAFITAGAHAADIKREDGSARWLVYGIAVTLVGVAVQQGPFLRAAWFNHNDAYHLIQIVGLYFFFRCAQTVRDGLDIS